ncbi:MAG: ABC transporter ATP-binding protein/permease [Clostridiales bacterium]|nr:ABC transporter ATP-binding protein/permease [Clostridiales bacterium]MDO4350504.1 ABC transporter ATP-binding protein [Eubacteriales bacterium]MDY4009041.1 ABC transporter ATP-binding protein [Candidatus Limiplasma sp.]
MRSLFPFLKPYRKECVLSPLFKLFEAVLELFVPLIMAAIIDNGIQARDTGYVLKMGLMLVGLGLLGFLTSITAQYFAAKAAVGFAARLKAALFAHIQRFSYTELDTLGAPTLINRMTTDMNQVQTGVNMTLRLLLRSPFVVVGAMIMAFTVDSRSALIFVALIPLLALVVAGLMRLTLPRHKRVQGQLDRVLLTTRENLTGVRVLRAFGKQDDETAAYEADTQRLSDMQQRVGRLSALMNPLTYVLVNGALAALLWSGALQVQSGALTQGAVVALVNYLSQILVELIKFANLIVTITKAVACAGRIESVLHIQPSMAQPERPVEAPGSAQECVRFESVSARYQNAGGDSLSNISFTALRGQTIGVIGGTGSGKTTLVNLIPRFYDATQGRVLVNGVDVKQQAMDALRQKISVVPQKAVLFEGTIRENLLWGNLSATDEQLWRALETAQAAEVVRGKAGGLDEPVEQGGRNLSGGQRQRLTIARALVKQPEILILDDSASALDYATDAALRKSLRQMEGGATVFIVSQRASSIRHADLILVLDDGELVGSGTHEQLLQGCPVYQEIYYSQYPKEAV